MESKEAKNDGSISVTLIVFWKYKCVWLGMAWMPEWVATYSPPLVKKTDDSLSFSCLGEISVQTRGLILISA